MKTDCSDAQTKQVATQNKPTLRQWVAKMSDQIKNALPANITPERMTRIALTALSKDAKLANSTPESFMGALLTSAQLGLECNTPLGQAYLIPYNNKGKIETQFQLGYQGLLDLCYRTGQYKSIVARVVYEGDIFDFKYGTNEFIDHKPMGKSNNPTNVYARYTMINGAESFEVMSWESVMAHAKKFSQSVNSSFSPWTTNPELMACKTVLKKLLKYAPKTVEKANLIAEAVNGDSAIIRTNIIKDGNQYELTKHFDYMPEIGTDEKPELPQNKAEIAEPMSANIANEALESGMSVEDEAAMNAAFDSMPPQVQDPSEIF